MDLLIFLVQRHGQLVSREDIVEKLWGKEVFVDVDSGVKATVRKIRSALKDDPTNPTYLETVVGKGYRFIGEVELVGTTLQPAGSLNQSGKSQPGAKDHAWTVQRLLQVLAGVTILLAAATWSWFRWSRRADSPPAQIRSIAVLPLANLSGDASQDYFADGMTDELITDLAQIRSLRVISRTSVMRYKGSNKSLPQIARELGVDGIVEGAVDREGDRVRITAQLIRAADDRHLWAQSFDRDLRNLLALQGDVARSIAERVQARVNGAEKANPVNPEAHELYLKGRYFWFKRTEASIDRALDYFTQSVAKDPSFAAAYSGLADCYLSLGSSFAVGSVAPRQVQPKALAAVIKALQLDDSLAEAHSSLALIKLNYEWDWPAAEREFQRSIDLNPEWANEHHWYAHELLSAGRVDDAERESRRALELDPTNPVMSAHLGWHYYFARQYQKSLQQLQTTIELDPNFGQAYWYRAWDLEQQGNYPDALREMLRAQSLLHGNHVIEGDIGHLYAVSGDRPKAELILRDLQQLSSHTYVNPFEIALIYAGLGQKQQAFEWLERAYRDRSDMLVYLRVDPRLDPLRSDKRFAFLLSRVGIPKQ